MPQPYIHSFAHIPTIRSKFPSNTSSHTQEGHGHGQHPEFDFVIIGGGPSGCALATRLYERTQGRVSVLLVEAGMHPEESPELNNCVPRILQTRALHRSAFDYAYPTEHEHNDDKDAEDAEEGEARGKEDGRRALVLNSGKVLGGSTYINFGIWTKGAKADYDLWSSLVGSDEFSWAKMGPCFDRVAFLSSLSSHSTTHSTPTSPIKTRLISQSPRLHYWSGIAQRGLEDSGFLLLGSGNSGGINGGLAEINSSHSDADKGVVKDVFGEMTECIDAEQVRSTALGYFEDVVDPLLLSRDTTSASAPATPETPARGKFEVWTSLRVERVVFGEVEGRKEGKKAVGVQTRFGVIRARREVILCAGAIQSPYILLQSGIGPAPHLAARGVPLVHDSPGVGRNLWEHPFVDVRAKLRPAHRKDTVETFASLMTSAPHLHQWSTERTGLMSGLPYEWLAYSNMHAELSPLFTSPSPSYSQPPSASSPSALIPPTPTDTHILLRSNAPHIEHLIHYGHGLAPAPDAMSSSYIAVSTVLLVPRSRGYVEIPPASPETGVEGSGESLVDEKPRIVVNQLRDPIDRRVLREAVRRAFAILGAPAWREYLEDVGEKGDAELDDIVRQRVTTLWHYGGTCAMKTPTSTLGDGVVDTRFRVEGVEGLRVADTSVLPFPVVGHTQAVAYAIGEKMAELLAREYTS